MILEDSNEQRGGIHIPEFELRPLFPFDASPIELRDSERHLVIYILIQDTHKYDWKGRECQIDQ